MAKQQVSQRYVFKIHSSRFRRNKWSLSLSIEEAKKNEELIALGDSQVMRFIADITNNKIDEEKIREVQREIDYIKKEPSNNENKNKFKKLNKQKDNLKFVKDYMCLIIDKNKDYDIATNEKKGIFLNGVKFKRLLATTGGAKKSTIVFVSERVHRQVKERIANGRDMSKKLVAGKLEAYQALACSTSIPVSDPKGILVVNDCETQFKTNTRLIYDKEGIEEPIMEDVQDYNVTLSDSDGYGLILPELSKQWANDIKEDYLPSGFCIRNSFTKGMVFTFDFRDFAKKIAKNNIVTDVWGNTHNINDIQLILTTSMLKLWDSYKSIEHYLECCKKNGYTFSVTKVTDKELDNERNLNYQFIQSLDLNDGDIEKLVTPTINEINDILDGDYRKSLLFLRGIHLTDKNINVYNYDLVEALMADTKMLKDPFVKQRIHHMIKKRINDAKIGVLKVKGNFSIVSGDPYSLCQSIFGLEVTGLLKAEHFYSNYWSSRNVKEVACFRAPMTCHNNVRKLIIENTEEMQYWYQYMNRCTIFNSWDTTAHALNGLDKDSDCVFTTDNKIILKGTHKTNAIICMQKRADKILVKEEDLIKANKKSFGDEIGSITNRITTMFDVRAKFSKDSEEYNTLNYRISCGQHF